jgi:uncharacterized protein
LHDLKFSKEGNDIYASIKCDAKTAPFKEQIVQNAFQQSFLSDAFLIPDEVSSFVVQANEFIKGLAEGGGQSADFGHKIAEIRDATAKVEVAKDKMSALLIIECAYDGEHLSVDDIKAACKAVGIRFGLKRSKVERLLEKSFEGKGGDKIEGEIAYGVQPKHGKNAHFRPLVTLFSDKLRKPAEKEGGKVDLRDLGDIDTVKPGERIYQKIPLTEGKPGRNVLGEDLPPTPGKDVELQISPGTQLCEQDPNVLVAGREGLARVIEERMEVDNVYSLPELTPKQGHIKFNGSVIISGDVSPEMKIIATGDVVVGGFVESATIRCQGEITVIAGASGKLYETPVEGRKYNCLLESGNRINIAFANQIDIKAKRDVFVHKQLSHCNVTAASLLVGQGIKPNGKLIGGTINVSKSVDVGHLGAPAGAETQISLNRTYNIFKQKEELLWEKIQPYADELETLKAKLKTLMSDEDKATKKKKHAEVERFVEKLMLQRKRLIQRRRDYLDSIEVNVYHTLYNGTSIEIGDKRIVNDRERGPSIVHLVEMMIEIEPK